MSWCDYDAGSESSDPSLCQLLTAMGSINLVFIVILCGRTLFLANIIALDLIGGRLRLLSFLFLFACCLEAVLSLVLVCFLNFSSALIFSQTAQALGWIVCGLLVILETWRIRNWPWIVVKIYLCVVVLLHAVLSSTLQTEDYSSASINLSLSHLAIAFILLVLTLSKDFLKTPEDLSKEEIRRVSGEFIRHDPINRNQPYGLLSSIFGGYNKASDKTKLHDSISLLHDDNELMDEFSIDFSTNDIKKQAIPVGFNWTSNSSKPLVVESAIDRNMHGGVSPNSKAKVSRSTMIKSLFSKQKDTNEHVVAEGDDLMEQQCLTADESINPRYSSISSANSPYPASSEERSNSSISFRSQDSFSTSSGVSRALMQVMDQHKAKLSASNPILEPRGTDDSSLFTKPSSVAKRTKNDESNKNELKNDGSSKMEILLYQVTVQRWGIRNRKLSEKEAQEYRRLNMIEDDSSDLPLLSETEFEIIINNRNQDSHEMVEQGGWNNTQKVKMSKWTVWRTAAELNKLHSQMLNYLGDLTPRRPRLHAVTSYDANSSSANFSYAELMADMRAIAIYLNALIRIKNGMALKPLREFLELDKGQQQLTSTLLSATSQPLTATSSHLQLQPTVETTSNSTTTTSENTIEINSNSKGQMLEDWERDVLKKPTSEPSSPNHNNSSAKQNSSMKGAAIHSALSAGQSLMDAAEISASNLSVNNQEKWRKLFFRMKIKLKPTDIGIRCRLFEGVLSGSEVSAWLIHSDNSSKDSEIDQYRHARDRFEACAIGQELLDCGLLLPVCAGFIDEEGDNEGEIDDVQPPSKPGQEVNPATAASLFEEKAIFSDMPGYIYRFPLKSGTAGSWSLFGAPVNVKIPIMTFSDENDKYTRDTIGFSIFDASTVDGSNLLNINSEEQHGSGSSNSNAVHVKYLIDISHGNDSWQTTRRYREFEQLQKQLAKEGVKADAQLPPKTIMNVISRVASSGRQKQLDDTRRIGLEQYLTSAVQAVIDSGSDRAQLILAQFLDDEYHNLRIINP